MYKSDATAKSNAHWPETDAPRTLDSRLNVAIHQLAQLASFCAHAPMALIAIEQGDGSWCTVGTGINCSWETDSAQSFTQSLFQRTLNSGQSVTVRDLDDVRENGGDHPLRDLDATAYAVVPLKRSDGSPIGVISVFDTAARDWTDEEINGLNHVATLTVAVVEMDMIASQDGSSPADTSGARPDQKDDDERDVADPGQDSEDARVQGEQSRLRSSHNEQRYRSLFDFNLNAVFEFDLQGNFVDANPACEELTGYSIDELCQITFMPLIVPGDQEKAWEIFRSALSGEPQQWDIAIHRRDGQRVELEGNSVPMLIDDEVVGVFGIARDVTDRQQAETALREREAELRFQQSLLVAQGEASIDGFMVVSSEGEILSYNDRFVQLWGIPEEVMASGSILEARYAILNKLTDPDGFLQRIHYLYDRPDEECHDEVSLNDGRTFERHSALVRTGDGGHLGRIWFYRDITDRKQAEDRLLEQTSRLDSLVTHNPDLVATLDFQGVFQSVNRAYTETLGYQAEEIVGQSFTRFMNPRDHARARETMEPLVRGLPSSFEASFQHRDGYDVQVSLQGIPIIVDDEVVGFWSVGKDVTEANRLADELRRSESQLIEAQRIAGIGHWEWDVQTNELFWSDETYRILGFSPHRVRPTLEMFVEAIHPDDREAVQTAIAASQSDGAPYDIDIVIVVPAGEERHINAQGEVTFAQDGTPVKMAGTVLDITERKRLEQELAYRADHDPLTGLVNRHRLFNHIEHVLADPERASESNGLLFIDLDDFKAVNDSLGHDAGDELLMMVAERLLGCVREYDTVARLGGDEFVVLMEHITTHDEAVQVAERIMSSLQQPFSIQGATVSISPSVGIVPRIPAHESPEAVLQDADLAMYGAKKQGKARYEVFRPSMYRISHDRIELQNELREAVEQERFTLSYQSIIRLDTGDPIGAEALLRWNSPVLGSISPVEFIPIAEQSGLINPIGEWTIREAAQRVRDWNEQLSPKQPLVMCINLSPMQLRQRDFVETIESALHEYELDPRSLCFEITETSKVAGDGTEQESLRGLRELGIRMAIDDFGTGESSLSYLKDLPVDWLKIDRSFVNQLARRSANNAIVMAIVRLAHALEMQVIAEGVETAEQLDIVRELGCDMAQGYYITTPGSDEETFRFLIETENTEY